MALAPRVLDEDHLAGADPARLTVAGGELDRGADYTQALRRRQEGIDAFRRRSAWHAHPISQQRFSQEKAA